MANPSQGSRSQSSSGILIVVVIAIVLGMFLFGKGGPEPGTVAANGKEASSGPSTGGLSGLPEEVEAPVAVPPVGRQGDVGGTGEAGLAQGGEGAVFVPHRNKPIRKAKGGKLSIKDVVDSNGQRPRRVMTDKINRTGDWAIEEVPLGNGRDGLPSQKLAAPEGAELKTTTKGDWVLEEAGGNTEPAAELKLSDPKKPKATKKGDWELEVD